MAIITGAVLGGLIELGKLGLQTYLQAMRLAGKTPEEVEEMYQEEKLYFNTHSPDTLPEVPPDITDDVA